MSNNERRVYHLCVVGAGLVGSAAARHAALEGHSVCLVGPPEPNLPEEWIKRDIFGSHYDEGRITRIWDTDPNLRILNAASVQRYRELEQQSGIKFHNPVGCLFFGHNSSEMVNTLCEAQEKDPTFQNMIDLSNREAFKSRFPFLRYGEDESAFLESGDAGHVSPRRLVEAQQIAANQNGCFIVREVVEQITQEVTLKQVVTESGQNISCRNVLLCTNAFTSMKPGLLSFTDKKLNFRLRKRTVALARVSESEQQRLNTMPSMIYRGEILDSDLHAAYILPPIRYPDGHYYLKIGLYGEKEESKSDKMTLQQMKEWFVSQGRESRAKKSITFLKNIMPDLRVECMKRVSCVMCNTPSGLPYIDSVTSGIYVAVGGNGVSAKCSDELGRIAALLAADNTWDSQIPKERFAASWM